MWVTGLVRYYVWVTGLVRYYVWVVTRQVQCVSLDGLMYVKCTKHSLYVLVYSYIETWNTDNCQSNNLHNNDHKTKHNVIWVM